MRATWLMVVALGSSCGHHDEPPRRDPAGSAGSAGSAGLAVSVARDAGRVVDLPASASVQVIAAGAEPRQKLAYHLPVGAASKLVFVTDANMMGEQVPTLRMATSTTVTALLPDGSMKIRVTIDDVTATDPANAAAATMLTSRLAVVKGATLTATLDPSGGEHDLQLSLAGGQTGDQRDVGMLTQSLSYLTVRLPAEPVGVNATWRQSVAFRGGGMQSVATTTVQLTSIDGDHASFEMTTELGVPAQQLTDDAGTVSVDGISGSGAGELVVDLGTLGTHGQLTTNLHAAWNMGGSASASDAALRLVIDTIPSSIPHTPPPVLPPPKR